MAAQGRLGDKGLVPGDAHGCPACPHTCVGPSTAGSPDTNVNGRAALRVGDPGVHAACCGPNTWVAAEGSSTVFINGRAAHRLGDATKHCGGMGHLIEGSPNVFTGGGKTRQTHEEAGFCIGTPEECAPDLAAQKQQAADAMTDEQAMNALGGQFLHDPRSLTPAQVKGLEALSRKYDLDPVTKGGIDSFLKDYHSGTDTFGLDGQLGRPDAPKVIPSGSDDV